MYLWVEVKSKSLPNSVIYLIENSCSALPVKLKLFEANKQGDGVLLNWITLGEYNNWGYYIEKRIGDGEWNTIAFVNSNSSGGNIDKELSYYYADIINQKAVIQYRLKQVNYNGQYNYSPVRVIKNTGRNIISIFPNPTSGNVNIVFNDPGSPYKVSLYDEVGKLVREWKNNNTILYIENLRRGIYFVRISDINKNIVQTRKLVVQ